MDHHQRAYRRDGAKSCLIQALCAVEDAKYALAVVWCVMGLMHLTYLADEDDVQRLIKRAAGR